jgi:SAM-dependent methyltransferase
VNRIHPAAAVGFAHAADVYERARPSYPSEAVDWIGEQAGLGPGRVVADVGAGTGKLTRLLIPTGARVLAVEPIAEMREQLARTSPGAELLDGTAESLPLSDGSVDAITVAQAFHWFDQDAALPEFHRVLRPAGSLVLIWNMRDLEDPLQAAIEELLRPLRRTVSTPRYGAWRPALERSLLFGPCREETFRYDHPSTAADVCDRVASTSFVAAMPAAERDPLLDRVRELTDGLPERFPFRYRTEVLVFPRSSDRGDSQRGTSSGG